MIGGGDPFYLKFWAKVIALERNRRFSIIRKLHTGFRLVPTSLTLNDLEQRNSPHFAFFPLNSIALQADYATVVEDRAIMSVKYRLPVPVFYFWPKLTHPAARSLCDS